jgi:SAM-dependent methyltransferase/ribosomal protein S27AE
MRRRALQYLVCPECGGQLQVVAEREEGEHVIEGRLTCGDCGAAHPIRRGVPRLVPRLLAPETARTVDRFGDQWAEFRSLDEFYEAQFLGWIAPNDRASFAGQRVLEAGCGKGRHSVLASRWGARDVLATDLGPAVDVAFDNTRDRPNVHVVQADLLALPVRPQSFDVGFSVGVLHHVVDPQLAFRRLAGAVAPGGRVVAWVYGRENNEWIVRGVNPLRRWVTSRLPFRWVHALSKGPAAVLWAAGRGVYRPLKQGPWAAVGERLFYQAYINQIADFPFSEIHAIVHDHLTPPIAHYIRGPEFRRWFDQAGLVDVQVAWHNENSWRGTGVVPRPPGSEA